MEEQLKNALKIKVEHLISVLTSADKLSVDEEEKRKIAAMKTKLEEALFWAEKL